MTRGTGHPGFRPGTLLVAGLALSIGWGVRGNFGHEYGAMIPGALAAIAVCLLSGREDWRRRVGYFAMFGALGWGFGGSISYMQVIGYTHSGHAPSQYYGFAALFLIGFLWAGLGGAGTALPAVLDRERLTKLFYPLFFVFGAWWLADRYADDVQRWLYPGTDFTLPRQTYPFYWFDADWVPAVTALAAVCLYDLYSRRNRPVMLGEKIALAAAFAFFLINATFGWPWAARAGLYTLAALALAGAWRMRGAVGGLVFFGGLGALGGFIVHRLFDLIGLSGLIARLLVRPQGDLDLFRRAAELGMDHGSFTFLQRELLARFNGDLGAFRADLVTNWPNFVHIGDFSWHLGWMLGGLIGIAYYFSRFGEFKDGARLFLYLALGWLAGFLLLPVLLGVRMTPPRGDDWAGILGVYVAATVYFVRHGLAPAAYASLVAGTVGGVGFSGAAWLKLMMVRPGNPNATVNEEVVRRFGHYQGANWHSFLEQSYGFINGIGIALALAALAVYLRRADDDPRVRKWTEAFAVAFVLLFVVFVNWRKAVGTWVEQGAVPETMRMFWFPSVEFSAQTWFALLFWTVGVAMIFLVAWRLRRPVAVVPETWLGRGQLLFLVFLWVVVLFNFERALPGFREGRLITEGVITLNAALVTVLLLVFGRARDSEAHVPEKSRNVPYIGALVAALGVGLIVVQFETTTVRALYGDAHAGHGGRNYQGVLYPQLRFGPDAEWRINPLLKTRAHN